MTVTEDTNPKARQERWTNPGAFEEVCEALRQARGMLSSCGFEHPEDDPELVASWEANLKVLDAALAKARGEAS